MIAICNPKCENGGNCIAPNVCLCTGNKYGGVHCELEKCNSVPNIQYSNPNCTVTSCNITCNHGYQFVDGSKVIQINCEKGKFNLAPNQPHLNNTIPPACQRKIHIQRSTLNLSSIKIKYFHNL